MSNATWAPTPQYGSVPSAPAAFSPWFTAPAPRDVPQFKGWEVPDVNEPGSQARPALPPSGAQTEAGAATQADTPSGAPDALDEGARDNQGAEAATSQGAPSSAADTKRKKPELAAITEAELEAAQQRSFAEGLAEGRAQVLKSVASDRAQRESLIKAISSQWQFFKRDNTSWYEPLKRLSIHIAEELVRAELRLSPDAVAGLIEQCAQALDHTQGRVRVELCPADLDRLHKMKIQWPAEWRFEANPALSEGSVRLQTDDAQVQDLMENRLQAMATELLGEGAAQRQASSNKPFESNDLAADAPVMPALADDAVSDVEDLSRTEDAAADVASDAATVSEAMPSDDLDPAIDADVIEAAEADHAADGLEGEIGEESVDISDAAMAAYAQTPQASPEHDVKELLANVDLELPASEVAPSGNAMPAEAETLARTTDDEPLSPPAETLSEWVPESTESAEQALQPEPEPDSEPLASAPPDPTPSSDDSGLAGETRQGADAPEDPAP